MRLYVSPNFNWFYITCNWMKHTEDLLFYNSTWKQWFFHFALNLENIELWRPDFFLMCIKYIISCETKTCMIYIYLMMMIMMMMIIERDRKCKKCNLPTYSFTPHFFFCQNKLMSAILIAGFTYNQKKLLDTILN